MVNADLVLWRAVLLHGICDAAKGEDSGWIGSADFRTVCALAGVEPEAVAERFDPERYRAQIKAMFTAKRKEAYLRKHPETGHGAVGRGGKKDADSASFADDQSAKTGVSKRTVQVNAERGEKVTPAALAMVPMPPICPRPDTGE